MELTDSLEFDVSMLDDWAVISIAGVVLAVGLTAGLIAWLKGRRLMSILVWSVLGVTTFAVLVPHSFIEDLIPGLVGTYESGALTIGWVMLMAVAFALVVGLTAASRLAKPSSWWAQRRYASEKYDRAVERHGWARVQAR